MHDTRDDLNLGSLPELEPPGDAWPAVETRLDQRPARRWQLAAAAILLLSLAGGLYFTIGQDRAVDPEIDRWIAYSQVLEEELRAIRGQISAYRGHQAVAVAELEDMVAAIDARLGEAESDQDRLGLWQQRALVLDDLLAVYAMARYAGPTQSDPIPIVTRLPVTLASNEI